MASGLDKKFSLLEVNLYRNKSVSGNMCHLAQADNVTMQNATDRQTIEKWYICLILLTQGTDRKRMIWKWTKSLVCGDGSGKESIHEWLVVSHVSLLPLNGGVFKYFARHPWWYRWPQYTLSTLFFGSFATAWKYTAMSCKMSQKHTE